MKTILFALFLLLTGVSRADTRYLCSSGAACQYYRTAITLKNDRHLEFHNVGGAVCDVKTARETNDGKFLFEAVIANPDYQQNVDTVLEFTFPESFFRGEGGQVEVFRPDMPNVYEWPLNCVPFDSETAAIQRYYEILFDPRWAEQMCGKNEGSGPVLPISAGRAKCL